MSELAPSPSQRPSAGFFRWWAAELRGLGAGSALRRFNPGRPRLIIALSDSETLLLEERPRKTPRVIMRLSGGEAGLSRIGEAIGGLGRRLRALPLGLRLPRGHCLLREHVFPVEAADDIGRILDVEFEARSPFRAEEIFRDHFAERVAGDGDRVKATEIVLKRERADALLQRLGEQGLRPVYLDTFADAPPAGLPVNLLAPQDASSGSKSGLPVVRLLAALALVLGGSALFLHVDRLNREVARLDTQVGEALGVLNAARDAADKAGARNSEVFNLLQHKLRHRHLASLLEELSDELPDTAWLTELRISGEDVFLAGFGLQASDMVALIERSGLFEDAALDAPVTFDERLKRERFSIRARLSNTLAFIAGPERKGATKS